MVPGTPGKLQYEEMVPYHGTAKRTYIRFHSVREFKDRFDLNTKKKMVLIFKDKVARRVFSLRTGTRVHRYDNEGKAAPTQQPRRQTLKGVAQQPRDFQVPSVSSHHLCQRVTQNK